MSVAREISRSNCLSAAAIINDAMQMAVSFCISGARISDICEKSDSLIKEKCSRIQKSLSHTSKGLAFPTCLSLNNTICYFSPLADDDKLLKENDIVKIEMACHVDGEVAVAAHTCVIKDGPVTGRAADVLSAASTAAKLAMGFVKPGVRISEVTKAIQTVASAYGCNTVEDFISHPLERYSVDYQKAGEATFQENKAYAINIAITSGGGKPLLLDDTYTTIYKRISEEKVKDSGLGFSPVVKAAVGCPPVGGSTPDSRTSL